MEGQARAWGIVGQLTPKRGSDDKASPGWEGRWLTQLAGQQEQCKFPAVVGGGRLCVTLSLLSHAGCARLGRPDPTGQPSVGQAEESSLGKG